MDLCLSPSLSAVIKGLLPSDSQGSWSRVGWGEGPGPLLDTAAQAWGQGLPCPPPPGPGSAPPHPAGGSLPTCQAWSDPTEPSWATPLSFQEFTLGTLVLAIY